MNSYPLVSVIIPVFNREKYLAAALDSVFAQTYRPIEVIVVDDGSIDNSAAIAQAYSEVQYFYQSNQGVSVARNTGIAAAKGEFIAFLDSDDRWYPNKLSIQINEMLTHPDLGITATQFLNYLEPETEPPSWFNPNTELGERSLIIPSTFVVRQSVFQQIGTFSPAYLAAEDTEWIFRAKDNKIAMKTISEVLAQRRLHGQNLSWETESGYSARLMRILKDSIARKTQRLVKP